MLLRNPNFQPPDDFIIEAVVNPAALAILLEDERLNLVGNEKIIIVHADRMGRRRIIAFLLSDERVSSRLSKEELAYYRGIVKHGFPMYKDKDFY